MAETADERLEARLQQFLVLLSMGIFADFLGFWGLVLDFWVEVEAVIETLPNGAEFGDGSKEGAGELVDVMVEDVGVLDECVVFGIDGKLHLTEHVCIPQVDEYIISASVQPIHHSHQLQSLLGLTVPQNLLVNADYFLLSGGATTAKQIHDLESDDRDGGFQLWKTFVEFGADQQQSVDESIEVFDGVGMEVVDDADGGFGSNKFVLFNLLGLLEGQLTLDQCALQHVVVLKHLQHLLVNLGLFVFQ